MDQIFNFPANLVLTINKTNKPFQQQEVNSFSLFSIQFIIFSFMNVDPHLGTGDSRNTDLDTGFEMVHGIERIEGLDFRFVSFS